MRMRMTDSFEHFQITGFNDGDGLRAGDGGKAFQKIFNGFAAFQGVHQILQGTARADKNRRAAHDFGIVVNDAFQIFTCHIRVKITPPAELSPANMSGAMARRSLANRRAVPQWLGSAKPPQSKRSWSNAIGTYFSKRNSGV